MRTELDTSTSETGLNGIVMPTFDVTDFILCRNMIKGFYTSSLIFTILKQFGELSEEVGYYSLSSILLPWYPISIELVV